MNSRTPEPVRGLDGERPWRMEPGWLPPERQSFLPACRQTGQAGLPGKDLKAPSEVGGRLNFRAGHCKRIAVNLTF